MPTIAVIGAGNVGSHVARRAVETGHTVVLANSRGPESLTDLVARLGPSASAATVEKAAQTGDIVVVAVPISSYRDLPVEPFAGKIVVDTGNYYPDWNGRIPELDDETTTTSEILQEHLPSSRVVKALNNLGAADLVADAQAAGTPDRRALVVAGDDQQAKADVTALIDAFGFDVIDAGPLAEGWRYQRDLPAYGVRRGAQEMRAALAAATRYRDM
jgi:predicted dinucleotide-binding enzyme